VVALQDTTRVLLAAAARGAVERALANATLYLEVVGQVVVAWRWLAQALVAARGLVTAGDADRAFYAGKLAACRYFFRYELPRIGPQLTLLASLDATTLDLAEESF
jgi:butyryl-CoA dehydrogenase